MSKKKRKQEEPAPVEVIETPEETPAAEAAVEEPTATEPATDEVEAIDETPVSEEPAEPAVEGESEVEESESEDADGDAIPVDHGFPLSQVIEAILFASQKPVAAKELRSILRGAAEANPDNPQIAQFAKVKDVAIQAAIEVLEQKAAADSEAYEVRESVSGWQLVTKPQYAPWLRQIFPENRPARISAPAMETLAIIAYRQPITRADIEAVRGVAVDGVMQTLLDRGLLKIAGRAEIPGRPLLYETTQHFMEHFGLKNLDDLPNAGELRKIALPTAPIPEATPETPAAPEAAAPVAEETTPAVEESAPAEEVAVNEEAETSAPESEEVVVQEESLAETPGETFAESDGNVATPSETDSDVQRS